MSDYVVALALWPRPGGGWRESVVLLDREYVEEQGLSMASVPLRPDVVLMDIDLDFAVSLCAGGSDPRGVIDKLYRLVKESNGKPNNLSRESV